MRRSGFSLVELSIVLVILGLLVGGILAGQSLIQAAEVHSQISQLQKFRIATNAFKLKYNYLPGDFPPEIANPAGFTARANGYLTFWGDGKLSGAVNNPTAPGNEVPLFWADLAKAGLIEGAYLANACTYGMVCTSTDTTPLENIIPAAKISGNYITVWEVDRVLHFSIIGKTGISTQGTWGDSGGNILKPGMTPTHAHGLDSKLDDGFPLSGTVISRRTTPDGGGYSTGGAPGITPSGWGGSLCNTTTIYTLTNDNPDCGISIKF